MSDYTKIRTHILRGNWMVRGVVNNTNRDNCLLVEVRDGRLWLANGGTYWQPDGMVSINDEGQIATREEGIGFLPDPGQLARMESHGAVILLKGAPK